MRKHSSSRSISNQTIVGGVLIGTVLGAATAFLLSNSGKNLRKNLSKKCCEISEQAQELAEQIAEKSGEFTQDVSDRLFNGTKHRDSNYLNWVIGGLAGGILGISALAFLTNDSAKDARENLLHNFQTWTNKTAKMAGNIGDAAHDVAENFEGKVQNWVHIAQKFIDTLNGQAKNAYEKAQFLHVEESTLDKVIDWAAFGLKLYQNLKK